MKQYSTQPAHVPTDTRSLLANPPFHSIRIVSAFLIVSALTGCAATEEQRFPLDYLSGIEASSRLDTAREALPAYQRMGAELERRGEFADASIAYFNAGISARVLGRLQQALDADQKAVEMAERAGKPFQLSQALIGLGFTYISLNAPRQAIPVFERASRLARESRNPQAEARSQDGLGLAYRRLGKLDQAVDHQTQAVAILEGAIPVLTMEWRRFGVQGQRRLANLERNYGETLVGLGWNHYALRQWDPARQAFHKALDVGKGIRLPHVVASAQLGLGTLASRQRDFPTAVTHLEEALRLNPRPAFVASTQGTLGRVYRGMGKLPEAEEALIKSVAGYEELRSLLESETLRETFFEDKAETYEFLVLTLLERGAVSVVTLRIGRQEVAQRVQAFRDLIATRERVADTQRMAQALFNQFVRPALGQRSSKELIIVPHDALHYLPFQALMPAPDCYLIQGAPLYYYSSASLMQFTREKAQGGSPVPFAMGNPDLKDPTLNLRYAEREARAVADFFPGTVVLTRQEATKAKGREHSARHNVLHFATHAELDEADPMGSALLFTPGSGDDGRLEVQEIFGLDLHASLVVLSACETALGKLTRGDELTGLTRAFIYAGTPSVITTLWKVNDRASYELMQEFYRNLKTGRDKAEALRQAQLATLAKYPHPYYWAPYQLTGEPR